MERLPGVEDLIIGQPLGYFLGVGSRSVFHRSKTRLARAAKVDLSGLSRVIDGYIRSTYVVSVAERLLAKVGARGRRGRKKSHR